MGFDRQGACLSIARCPQRRRGGEPQLVAERHDLITQIKHHAGAEWSAELIPQRLVRGEVRGGHGRTRLDLHGRDRTVGLFQNHIHLGAGRGPEVVKRRLRIGPGELFAEFAHDIAFQQPPQQWPVL